VNPGGTEHTEPVQLTEADARVNGLRLAGGLIDVLVLSGVFLAISAATGQAHTGRTLRGTSLDVGLSDGALLLCLGLWLAYFWVLEATFGRTLGKYVCGLRVIDRSGRTPSPAAVLLRTVGRIIDALPFLYLLGIFVMFTGGLPSRRVGDRMAGTAVVRG
jgi:uncharacterized RDD family membrane protein YckC